MFENIVQKLARDIVMANMLEASEQLSLKPVLQNHDELDYVVPESEAESTANDLRAIMTAPPKWMPALPLAVEVHWGPTFGDCK